MLVHQSSTRRKSCTACVQAKRRCDLRLPQCSRCMKRKIACKYVSSSTPVTKKRQQVTGQHLNRASPPVEILPIPIQHTSPIRLPLNECNLDTVTNFDLLAIESFPFAERAVIKPDQIDFCITQFKSLIPQLVQQNKSPFIHPDSYQNTPPAIYQDLLGTIAMYSQKSPQNQNLVFSVLDSRVSSLIESQKSSSWLTTDYLLGVQALILYQSIRLFDGDIRQRANAERDRRILDSWTCHLSSTSNIYSNDMSSKPESCYKRWIFIESVRRTVLMSLLIQAMYALSKDGYCTTVPLMSTLPLSVNGNLWNASEEQWWESTLGFGGELVTYGDFTSQWSAGEALYTDTFETILIAACRHNIRRLPLTDAALL